MYFEEDMLMLSGVQHFVFCPRQWALIHVDQQWADNVLTTEGQILHQNVDNPQYRQKLNNRITLRSVHIASHKLGIYGITDAVELIPGDGLSDTDTIAHPKYGGRFIPYPIEYKRGHSKPDECDIMQLVCQIMCLEEMYNINIPRGALFYWEVRQREEIVVDDGMKDRAQSYLTKMHEIIKSGKLPKADKGNKCRRCSLSDICMPEISENKTVTKYLKDLLYEKDA